MAIGIFDSGMGGLTVLDRVVAKMPDTPFVYYADSAHAPYGVRDADEIFDLTTSAVSRLWEEGCDCLLYTSPSPRDVEESRMPSSA